jgi:2-polyprenyl-3-methyl-5-hydroxy-6-metoxy-1,4-benzoquinol methylase
MADCFLICKREDHLKPMSDFDSFAESYRKLVDSSVSISGESAEYFAEYKARYLLRKFGAKNIDAVLDYGCGIGSLAEQLKRYFPTARIDGYDPSRDSLQLVTVELREQGVFTENFATLSNRYDLVVIANVLHHVAPGQRLATMSQAIANLCVGGRLVIFEHNPFNPLTRRAVSQCAFDQDAILLRSSEARRLLRQFKMQKIRREFVVFFPRWLAALRPLEKYLSWLPLGAQFAISGMKCN